MKTVRSKERGLTKFGWLESRHSFSFGEYYDPEEMGWGPLRVLNDDLIGVGGKFPMHPHRDMEILSFIVEGSLRHEDSMGNGATVSKGEWQGMTAGRGVYHSEENPGDETMRLLQIWIQPRERGVEPSYAQTREEDAPEVDGWKWIFGPRGSDLPEGVMDVLQDAYGRTRRMGEGDEVSVEAESGRLGYVIVVEGTFTAMGESWSAGDAFYLKPGERVDLRAEGPGVLLWMDLPG